MNAFIASFIIFQLYYYYTFVLVHTPCAYKNASGDFTWDSEQFKTQNTQWKTMET